MLNSITLISVGAALGAVLRWLLGLSLNALFPAIPPGTLVANLVGGYLIGVAMEALALAGGEIALHVVGSVVLTILGIATVMALRRAS